MYPDLIARTCGYLGVFIALIVMGIWGEPEFAVTPQQSFDRIALSLHVLEAEPSTPEQEQSTEQHEPEEIIEPQTEPEPEPIPQPEEPPAPEPVEPELTPQAEPSPAPEVVTEPELTPPPTQVQTTPAPKEEPKKAKEPPKAESKPKAPEKAVEKPKPAPQTKPKPQQPKPRATTSTTQNKAKPQATAAKEAPAAPAAAAATTATDNDRQLRSQLSSLLVREIRSQLKYPRNAVRRKLEGTVMMEFEVKNGVVVGFVLRQSSGHKILDEAARKLAQKLVQFNTRLGAMNYRVQIPIKYELL